jgi:hypothetical protein
MSPDPEGERFRKTAGGHAQELKHIQRIGEFLPACWFEEVVRVVEIETGKLMEPHPFGKMGIRRSGNHIYLVTELAEGAAQIFDINALPAAAGIPPIGHQAYPQR